MEHLNLDPNAPASNAAARAQIAQTLAAFYTELAGTAKKPAPRFSLARAVNEMANGGLRSGYEKEVASSAAMIAGGTHDPSRIVLPWSVLTRDLLVSNTGQYLAPVDNRGPLDALRPFSVAARLGITVLPGLAGNTTIPKTGAHVSRYWLASENSDVSTSQPTLQQIALTPRTAGALVTVSRQLLLQGPATDQYLRDELMRSIGMSIDSAIIAGTGAEQPLGIVGTAGIGTTSGTSLSQTAVCAMLQAVAEANADDAAVSFLGTPAIRKLLQARERATGLGFVWDNGRVAGQPAFASTSVPTATLLCVHWPSIILGLWGPGVELQINPEDPALFKTGAVQMRCLVSCDVAVANPAAVNVSASIT